MDYPNPLHWDEQFARDTKFGGIVAPQSIAVALDYGHGAAPACVGHIPNSHLIFGGEEWWFYGCPVRPGDKLFQERRFHDYKVTQTKFAGPTMFSRGDTVHTNQHGTLVARERSTAIRYLYEEATKRGMFENQLGEIKRWTQTELEAVERLRREWLESNRKGVSPRFDEVKVGDTLPRRVIGPHSIASFTTEYRAFLFNIWGTFQWVAPPGIKDPWIYQDPGWGKDFAFDEEDAKIDPRKRDGLYVGPSRGHIDADRASEVGMARAYGYGATMGAWCTDYLAYWAGHEGMVRHSKADFRTPAFEGDVTYFDAEIVDKQDRIGLGCASRPGKAAPDQPERRDAGGLHGRGRTAVVAMTDDTGSQAAQCLSIVSGPPLSEEPGLGALTLPGFLREVTQMYGEREALVLAQRRRCHALDVCAAMGSRARSGACLARVRPGQGWPRRRADDEQAGMACRGVRYISGRRGSRHPQHLFHDARIGLPDTGFGAFGAAVRAYGADERLRGQPGRAGTGDRRVTPGHAGIGQVPVSAPSGNW